MLGGLTSTLEEPLSCINMPEFKSLVVIIVPLTTLLQYNAKYVFKVGSK